MELTAEQFEMLYLRRSQEDLNLVIEILANEGSISVPADSPPVMRAKEIADAEREADKEIGGEGLSNWEKRQASEKAERDAEAARTKDAEKAASKEKALA